ncbi:MAG TPA: DUF6580 family putative transport protein [Patescibacteria group bacterium]|nr:DUF6580 family putative transport protein [Patescibacteria group bacterium]
MLDVKKHGLTILVIVAVAAVASRLVPHYPNMGVVTALSIFAAAYLPLRTALVLTLAVRLVSDYFLGFFSLPLMVAVYGSHMFGAFAGAWLRKQENSNYRYAKIFGAGLISAIVFFLVTNFALLYPGSYPQNLSGIVQSYINALPFFRGTLLGDIGYTFALFALYDANAAVTKLSWVYKKV